MNVNLFGLQVTTPVFYTRLKVSGTPLVGLPFPGRALWTGVLSSRMKRKNSGRLSSFQEHMAEKLQEEFASKIQPRE